MTALRTERVLGYRTLINRKIVGAFKAVFDGSYYETQFRNLQIGTEFGLQDITYPQILIEYHETEVSDAGVGHEEWFPDPSGIMRKWMHSRFEGMIEITINALSPLDRDMLADAIVEILRFGRLDSHLEDFFITVYGDPALDTTLLFSQVTLGTGRLSGMGNSTSLAPFDPEDIMVYSTGYQLRCNGGFYNGNPTTEWEYVNAIDIRPYTPGIIDGSFTLPFIDKDSLIWSSPFEYEDVPQGSDIPSAKGGASANEIPTIFDPYAVASGTATISNFESGKFSSTTSLIPFLTQGRTSDPPMMLRTTTGEYAPYPIVESIYYGNTPPGGKMNLVVGDTFGGQIIGAANNIGLIYINGHEFTWRWLLNDVIFGGGAVSFDDNKVILVETPSLGGTSMVRVRYCSSGDVLYEMEAPSGTCSGVGFSWDSTKAYAFYEAGGSGTAVVIDLQSLTHTSFATSQNIAAPTIATWLMDASVLSMISPDGTKLAVPMANDVMIFDITTDPWTVWAQTNAGDSASYQFVCWKEDSSKAVLNKNGSLISMLSDTALTDVTTSDPGGLTFTEASSVLPRYIIFVNSTSYLCFDTQTEQMVWSDIEFGNHTTTSGSIISIGAAYAGGLDSGGYFVFKPLGAAGSITPFDLTSGQTIIPACDGINQIGTFVTWIDDTRALVTVLDVNTFVITFYIVRTTGETTVLGSITGDSAGYYYQMPYYAPGNTYADPIFIVPNNTLMPTYAISPALLGLDTAVDANWTFQEIVAAPYMLQFPILGY